jgi:serine protease SohB
VAFLTEYGLFLAKTLTLLLAIGAVILMVVSSRQPKSRKGELVVTDLSGELEQGRHQLQAALAGKAERKQMEKTRKAEHKAKAKGEDERSRLFVIDFQRQHGCQGGGLPAGRGECRDRRGPARGRGAAAPRIRRRRGARLRPGRLPVAAAAGQGHHADRGHRQGGGERWLHDGLRADKILAAPFAIVGSIGVIAQMPNFNKLLKKHDIEFEMHTAGQYKRTITMFGENDDLGREKFREELGAIHEQFKAFVAEHRPGLDIDKVTTGEHWLASQAKQLWWMRFAPAMTTCWPRPAITRWSASATANQGA